MAESLVLELQKLAADPAQRLPDLLRRALIVATKLELDEFRTWIELELAGYGDVPPPPYRTVKCRYFLGFPGQKPQRMAWQNSSVEKAYCIIHLNESVQTLQYYLEERASDGSVEITIAPEVQNALRKSTRNYSYTDIIRTVPLSSLSAILDAVRTMILKWALRLEADGVLGEGMSFSAEEKEKAQRSPVINIENFSGILGTVSGGQIVQSIETSIQHNDFGSLETALANMGISKADIALLQKAVTDDPRPSQAKKFGPKVGKWLGAMVQKAAEGGLKIGVDVTSKVLSEMLLKFYGLKS